MLQHLKGYQRSITLIKTGHLYTGEIKVAPELILEGLHMKLAAY